MDPLSRHLSERRAQTFDYLPWFSDHNFTGWLIEHLRPLGATLCDVGAGTGLFASTCARVFDRVIAVEPSAAMLRRMVALHPRGTFEPAEGSAEDIPFDDDAVELALAKSSLHHFVDIPLGLAEMARVASRHVAVVEVVGHPAVYESTACLEFLRELLVRKEPSRDPSTLFSEVDLVQHVESVAVRCRAVHFDQYLDVETWIAGSDLEEHEQASLLEFVLAQPPDVAEPIQLHRRGVHHVMLRRMALVVGELP